MQGIENDTSGRQLPWQWFLALRSAANPTRTGWRGYVVAATSVSLAMALGFGLRSVTGRTHTPLFIAAVMVSAWWGELGPGLLATILATLALDYFFITPEAWLSGRVARRHGFRFQPRLGPGQ